MPLVFHCAPGAQGALDASGAFDVVGASGALGASDVFGAFGGVVGTSSSLTAPGVVSASSIVSASGVHHVSGVFCAYVIESSDWWLLIVSSTLPTLLILSITCQNLNITLWLLLNLYYKHNLSITFAFML